MMPRHIVIPNLREGYQSIIDEIVKHGDRCAPRGQQIIELLYPTIVVEDPTDCLMMIRGRKANLSIGAAEALQLVGGFSDPDFMARVSPVFRRYMDSDDLNGAYGSRVYDQLFTIERLIKGDRDTRQAVLMIAHPDLDIVNSGKDFVCTVYLQFLLRRGKLHCSTSMRSNDIYLGMSYDLHQFTTLQCSLANALDVEVGDYVHNVGSLHLYERDFDKISELGTAVDGRDVPRLHGIGRQGQSMPEIVDRARAIYECRLNDPTTTESWFIKSLAPFLIGDTVPSSRRITYREVFFAHNGFGPYVCAHCTRAVHPEDLVVHHADHDRSNSSPVNLLAMHEPCHMQHHQDVIGPRPKEACAKISETMRGRPKSDEHRRHLKEANKTRVVCECGYVTARATASRHQRATGHSLVEGMLIDHVQVGKFEQDVIAKLAKINGVLKDRDITQQAIAELTGYRQPAISRYLRGEWMIPMHIAIILADLTDVDVSDILPVELITWIRSRPVINWELGNSLVYHSNRPTMTRTELLIKVRQDRLNFDLRSQNIES